MNKLNSHALHFMSNLKDDHQFIYTIKLPKRRYSYPENEEYHCVTFITYNPVTKKKNTMSQKLNNHEFSTVTYGNGIFCTGDIQTMNSSIFVWPREKRIITLPSMLHNRTQHCLCRYNYSVIAICGVNSSSNFMSSCEMYNFNAKKWSQLPSTNKPKSNVGGYVKSGMLYIVGGSDKKQDLLEIECLSLHLTTTPWTLLHVKNNFPTKRILGPTIIPLFDNRVLVANSKRDSFICDYDMRNAKRFKFNDELEDTPYYHMHFTQVLADKIMNTPIFKSYYVDNKSNCIYISTETQIIIFNQQTLKHKVMPF